MASELRVNTLKDASGNNSVATSVVFGGSAKHWVLLGSSGTSVTDSFNNASVADNGTGDYTLTRTNNMANATFCVNITSGSHGSTYNAATDTATQTTAVFDIRGANATEGAVADIPNTNGAVHGDLA
jgi:hypothetical protein